MSRSNPPGSVCRSQLETSRGSIALSWTEAGLRSVRLGRTDEIFGTPSDRMKREMEELRRYLAGEKVRFRVRLDLGGLTPFQADTLKICAAIPYGQTRTYGELAKDLGRPNAARAVGGAMGANPVPIVIPCHRVLPSGGGLGGYSGELDWKRFLLNLEGVEVPA